MTTRISTNNLDSSVTANFSPKISGIAIADNSYTILDDTAVNISGGFIIISGSNFVTGCSVLIGSVVATSVSFINSTTVRAQVPAQAAGSYTVYVTNPDGGLAIRINGLNYSATPTWSTTSPLPGGQINAAISIQLSAISTGNVTYALQAGSSLPAGVTLSNVGLLSGTVTGITTDTTYNFTVVATDTELQDTPQAFSITITASDQNFRNTSLLLSANTPGATFVTDASTNAFNVSVFGDTRPNAFSPYTEGYYSNYFDSSGDFLTISHSTPLNLSSGDFTIEAFVYWTGVNSFATVLNKDGVSGSSYASYDMSMNNSGYLKAEIGSGNGISALQSITSNTLLPRNSFVHVAFVKNGSNLSLYQNGISVASATQTATITDGGKILYIGYQQGQPANRYWDGYISNLRIVKGTAVYTANFTPPTAPLTAIANTSLLTCQSNRFIDNSTNNFTITRNGDTRIDGFIPFVPATDTASLGSAYFDGTGDHLSIPSNTAFNCGTGDFTLECWFYDNGTSALYPSIFSSTDWSTGTGGISLRYNNTGLANRFSVAFFASNGTPTGGSGINELLRTSNTYPTRTWHHVAFVRSAGNVFSLYVNGVRDTTTTAGSITIDWNLNNNGPKIGGGNWDGADSNIRGYISNLRLIKGTALYNGTTYTVPAAPLTAIANTSLLTLQTNQPVNNNQFVDRSTNNFLITRNGNTTAGSFSPYAGGWSNYFDGTGDYLSFTNTNNQITFGTDNFTIEFWVNFNNPGATNTYEVVLRNYNTDPFTTDYFYLGKHVFATVPGAMSFWVANFSTSGPMLSDPSLPSAGWMHYAIVRNSNTWTMYRNGTGVHSVTSSVSMGTRNNNLCQFGVDLSGYISNLRTVKGTAVYTANFTLPTAPLTPITNTSLLTCADNRFVDDSANNFTITRNGDVSVQKFSPFSMQTQTVPTSYSVYFDGTGDYLSVPDNEAFNFTGDFTIECWLYPTSHPANVYLIGQTNSTDYGPVIFALNSGRPALAVSSNGSTWTINGFITTALTLNTWSHVAVVRSGNKWSIYVNGVENVITASTAVTPYNSTDPLGIGSEAVATINYPYVGYISNLRIVKGTAVYTANFTPPTAPLTAIANTSLLTCQSTTIIDNSTNNFTITVNGNSQPLAQNPFGYTNPTAGAYTATALGGSMYFDGTGDFLTAPANAAFAFGQGDFTIEAWVYPTASLTATTNIGLFYIEQANGFVLGFNGGNIAIGRRTIAYDLTSTYTPPVNTWTHIAVTRLGATAWIFANGVQVGTVTASGSNPANNSNYVCTTGLPTVAGNYGGGTGNAFFTGYIGDLKIVKGQGLYTSNFVPPAAPVPAAPNTVLLLRGTAAGVYDSTMNNNLETVGDARINTSITRFAGRSSIFFDGTGDWLINRYIPIHEPGSANLTWEMWIRTTSSLQYATLYSRQPGAFTSGMYSLLINSASATAGDIALWVADANAAAPLLITTGVNIRDDVWHHIAVVRNGSAWALYVDGTSRATATWSGAIAALSGSGPYIAADQNYGRAYTGYISDLRITNGVARYTANFTAPTAPFIQY